MNQTISQPIIKRKEINAILKDLADHYKADTIPLINELRTKYGYSMEKIADLMGKTRQALQQKYDL